MRGFIKQYIVHFEWHPGYRPHFSIRKRPRAGQRVNDAGITGVIEICRNCSGDGVLLRPDIFPEVRKLLSKSIFDPPLTSKFLDEVGQGLWRGKARMTEEGITVEMKKREPSRGLHDGISYADDPDPLLP